MGPTLAGAKRLTAGLDAVAGTVVGVGAGVALPGAVFGSPELPDERAAVFGPPDEAAAVFGPPDERAAAVFGARAAVFGFCEWEAAVFGPRYEVAAVVGPPDEAAVFGPAVPTVFNLF
jgi:hypothetical protein